MALYRKYRPATFAEVVGQEHVTEPLSIALDAGRINHAYLFSGPRGCGKTSSARILARSLNCVEGPTSTPCGVCASCVALAPGGPGNLDVTEMDAASHGGVDDARELRDRAFYAPAESRYRVFIVDEAHMVTTQGFNALLKIVEEPPEHLIFIFATTEPEKVLTTIRSRTHHYPFRLLAPNVMRPLLEDICAKEHVPVEPTVYPLVIRAGGGSPRDSLSILDQLLAGAGEAGVTYNRALGLLGVTDTALIDAAVDALAEADGAGLFGAVEKVMEAGHDPRRFATDLLERFRDLILLNTVPDAGDKGLVDVPVDVLDHMRGQAGRLGLATLTRSAEVTHAALNEMRGATSPRLLLEVMCARMLLPAADDSQGALLQRIETLERRPAGAAPADPVPAAAMPAGAPAGAPSGGAPAPDAGQRFVRPSQRQAAAPPESVSAAPEPRPTAQPAAPEQPAPPQAVAQPEAQSAPAQQVQRAPAAAPEPRVTAAPEPRPATQPAAPESQTAAAEPAVRPAVSEPRPTSPEARADAPAPRIPAPDDLAPPAERRPEPPSRPAAESEPVLHRPPTRPQPAEPGPVLAEPAFEPTADVPAASLSVDRIRTEWPQVLRAVKSRNVSLHAMMPHMQVQELQGDLLLLTLKIPPLRDRFREPYNQQILVDSLTEVFGVPLRVQVGDGSSVPQAPAAAPTPPRGGRQAPPKKQHTFQRPSRAGQQSQAPDPWQNQAPSPRPAASQRGGGDPYRDDDIPLPPEPDPEPAPEAQEPPEPVREISEEEMMADAAAEDAVGGAAPVERRDPDEVALELLKTELGARPI